MTAALEYACTSSANSHVTSAPAMTGGQYSARFSVLIAAAAPTATHTSAGSAASSDQPMNDRFRQNSRHLLPCIMRLDTFSASRAVISGSSASTKNAIEYR